MKKGSFYETLCTTDEKCKDVPSLIIYRSRDILSDCWTCYYL